MSNSDLATKDEGKLIYTGDDMSINLYQVSNNHPFLFILKL